MEDQSRDTNAAEAEAQTIRFHHLESAIDSRTTSFYHLSEALFYQEQRFKPDDRARRIAYKNVYPRLLESFESKHGRIVKLYPCKAIMAAAVLTENGESYSVCSSREFETAETHEILFESEYLQIEARRLLDDPDRRLCIERFFSIICYVLEAYDLQAQAVGKSNDATSRSSALEALKKEFERAKNYYIQCVQRRAQVNYFYGMLLGILILLFGAIMIDLFLHHIYAAQERFKPILFSYGAGGTGAIVSVMSRMTFEGLVLKHDAGKRILMILGAFRPLIGGVFGLVFYIFLMSTILPIALPNDPTTRVYFFAGVAFLAGFSERWAQDMLVVSQHRLAGKPTKQDSISQTNKAQSARR